jgi:hypothetical protein
MTRLYSEGTETNIGVYQKIWPHEQINGKGASGSNAAIMLYREREINQVRITVLLLYTIKL